MKAIKKFIQAMYVNGEPVLQDNYWHVKWQKPNGETHVTAFGWKDKKMAETHIQVILQGA
jgi:hypothetical protein